MREGAGSPCLPSGNRLWSLLRGVWGRMRAPPVSPMYSTTPNTHHNQQGTRCLNWVAGDAMRKALANEKLDFLKSEDRTAGSDMHIMELIRDSVE